ncbi:flavin reductase family protein, partial [Pseudomonas aeruginosa]|uniref:flavin reductase family protein n=1 Tax=Pseudomonas aeruginosa TaxID=287 RepID=UPI00265DD18F
FIGQIEQYQQRQGEPLVFHAGKYRIAAEHPELDKFAGIAHQQCNAGVPILTDALATLVCRNVNQYEGGDHLIFIGQIEQYQQRQGEPLVFHAGKYRIAAEHPEL